MRFAYADPPYPGQSKRWYSDHPDYAGEVDHAELIGRLCGDYPDGWALSTSAPALREVLPLCPPDVRMAVWHLTNTQPPPHGQGPWHWCWEPVIIRGGRKRERGEPPVRNLLACPNSQGFLGAQIAGQKPPAFCRWIFGLLGARHDDELDDLYPGSGAVGREWDAYINQPWLPVVSKLHSPEKPYRRERRQAREGVPSLMDAADERLS
jgi:hypothetical protein